MNPTTFTANAITTNTNFFGTSSTFSIAGNQDMVELYSALTGQTEKYVRITALPRAIIDIIEYFFDDKN